MVHYANVSMCGLDQVASLGDGSTISLTWFQAYPDNFKNQIAYNIYYSIYQDEVFSEGAKYISIDSSLSANIIGLTPGQEYWFSVRPIEYDPTIIDYLSQLPIVVDNLRAYPNSMLRQDMSATDLIVPLLDVEGFPTTGIVKVGIELIEYLAVDSINNNLIVPGSGSNQPASLVLQSNGKFFLPSPNNIGTGTINSLTLLNSSPPAETWNILCVFVEQDGYGNLIPGTAKFEAIGSVSESIVDQYGNFIVWTANGTTITSNGILSFSITETTIFHKGDSFLVQNTGSTLGASGGRGFNNTPITLHTVAGFDGYNTWSSVVGIIVFTEDTRFDNIYACQSRFEYPNFPFTIIDGYHQTTKDILSTDLTAADAANVGFPMYDYAGYHRTDPVLLLTGVCVGSYIGGTQGCIDQYGNNNLFRGLSLEDQNTQRQDVLLSVTGRPACLIKRTQTGITCNCYLASSEYPDDRCPNCLGTKFQIGYDQYFNPRRSDGRILLRTSPTAENLKMHDSGLESEYPLDMWTLTVPTIKTRDIIILFDQDDNEEFRYEVSNVIRNNTIVGLDGGQHMNTFRIRKTDPAYQFRAFRNTQYFPATLNTSLGMAPGAFPPHSHEIRIDSSPVSNLSDINQTTGVTLGHQHEIISGIIQDNGMGHSHIIILP